MKFDRWLKLTIVIALPFFLTGCSLKSSTGTSSSAQTLTIWRVQNSDETLNDNALFKSLITGFEKQNSGVKIVYKTFTPQQDYETAVLNGLAAGNGPDIWEIRNDELPRQQDKLVGYPVGSKLTSDQLAAVQSGYASTISQEMVANNQIYGLPLAIDPLVLFGNTEELSKINLQQLPTTWSDIVQDANLLTQKVNGQVTRGGIALGTVTNVDRASDILQMIMLQFYTQMVDPSHRTATFELSQQDSPFQYPGKAAMAFYGSFANSNVSYQTWDKNQPYSTQAFIDGDVSMMINYLSLVPQIKRLNPKLDFSVGQAPQLPQQAVQTIPHGDIPASIKPPVFTAQYRALVVSKAPVKLTKAQQVAKETLAWNFINYAIQNSSQYATSVGLVPPQITSNSTSDTSSAVSLIDPHLVTWYKGPNPRSVDVVFGQIIAAVGENNQSIDTVFSQASQAVTTLLNPAPASAAPAAGGTTTPITIQ